MEIKRSSNPDYHPIVLMTWNAMDQVISNYGIDLIITEYPDVSTN